MKPVPLSCAPLAAIICSRPGAAWSAEMGHSPAAANTPLGPSRCTANGAGAHIGLRVPGDPELTHLLLFSTAVPFTAPGPDLAGAQLLRTPNRRDLYPADGIRLRTPGGEWLKPLVKSLSDPDVTIAADGARTAVVMLAVAGGQWFIAWAVALSRDGIPSELTGPFTIGVPS